MSRRLEFENGWTIDVHDERDGETYYQRWPPGVKRQSWLANLHRTITADFNEEIAKHSHKEARSNRDHYLLLGPRLSRVSLDEQADKAASKGQGRMSNQIKELHDLIAGEVADRLRSNLGCSSDEAEYEAKAIVSITVAALYRAMKDKRTEGGTKSDTVTAVSQPTGWTEAARKVWYR